MTRDQLLKAAVMRSHGGWIIGARELRMHTDYPGAYMVAEEIPDAEDLPSRDGSNGPWCIVGEDLGALIDQAFPTFADLYDLPDDRITHLLGVAAQDARPEA